MVKIVMYPQSMTFAETLREERLINRRSRGRKARILGRIIGFGLTACLVVALRTDPQLRGMVQDLALAVMGMTGADQGNPAASAQNAQIAAIADLGFAPDSDEAQMLEELGLMTASGQAAPAQVNASGAPQVGQMPTSRIKINRP